jgi:hypothetical protein
VSGWIRPYPARCGWPFPMRSHRNRGYGTGHRAQLPPHHYLTPARRRWDLEPVRGTPVRVQMSPRVGGRSASHAECVSN